jgi:hypothetical protein
MASRPTTIEDEVRHPGAGEEPAPEARQAASLDQIDLKALAEKIYQLLKKEARIERERLGRHHIW